MNRMLRKRREMAGFTLVELMVVVIIVGILAAVAVPVYRYNIRRAMASEGMAMVGSVRTAQRVWFAEHDAYTATWGNLSGQVDIGDNKYFATAPTLTATGTGSSAAFTATAAGAGDAKGISVKIDESGTVTTTGL